MSDLEHFAALHSRPGMRLVQVRDDQTTSRTAWEWVPEGAEDPVEQPDSAEFLAHVRSISAQLMRDYEAHAQHQPREAGAGQ